jgi:hypothetical protein
VSPIPSWKKELFILLDDAIVELAIHKTLEKAAK